MRKQLFNRPAGEPTMLGAMQRIGDGEGLRPSRGATMSLSTPIVSVQDGPRIMGTSNFGGKKAAPFRKGGKRRAKVLAAKAAVAKAKGGDYSNLDLGFRDSEARDSDGKWTGVGARRALAKALLKRKNRKDPSGGNKGLAAIQRQARLDTSTSQDDAIDLGFGHSVTNEARGTDGRWIRAAMRAKTQGERNAVRRGSFADYQTHHVTSHEEHSKVLGILDAADKAAKSQKPVYKGETKFSSIREPSPSEAKYLAAKNDLAKAMLSGKPRKIAKAKAKVAKTMNLSVEGREDVDLAGFFRGEPRDAHGEWMHAAGKAKSVAELNKIQAASYEGSRTGKHTYAQHEEVNAAVKKRARELHKDALKHSKGLFG